MRADFIDVLSTKDFSERVASLPVTKGSPYLRTTVFSASIGPVRSGDVLWVGAEWEVTNSLGFNVMVSSVVTLLDDVGASVEITEANGRNVTPDMHHDTIVKVGTYQADRDMDEAWIQVVAWSASTKAMPGNTLKVEQDYGRLSILRFREAQG